MRTISGLVMVGSACMLIGFVVGQILPRNSRDNSNCGSELDECNSTLEEYRNYKLSTEAYVGALEYQSELLKKCILLIE